MVKVKINLIIHFNLFGEVFSFLNIIHSIILYKKHLERMFDIKSLVPKATNGLFP